MTELRITYLNFGYCPLSIFSLDKVQRILLLCSDNIRNLAKFKVYKRVLLRESRVHADEIYVKYGC